MKMRPPREYKLQVDEDRVLLYFFPAGGNGIELRRYLLPQPLQPGDIALLEFRLHGDQLTGLLNGAVVVEAQDSHLSSPGEGGIIAGDGWFESVEVQKPGPDEEFIFAGHRFQLVRDKLPWNQAKAKAEAMGGHLATVRSKEENDWIVSTFTPYLKRTEADPLGDRCFLGGFCRNAPSTPWEWVTGEPLTIQPWMGDFRNDKYGGPKLLTLMGKEWDDVNASMPPCAFLVEWDDNKPAKPVEPAATKAAQ
jgi:hypothetical protein